MLPVSVLIRDRPKPYLLDADLSVKEAADFLRGHRIGGAPVVRKSKLIGFMSERDIVFRVVAEGRDTSTTMVADIMSSPVTTADVNETVKDCEEKMQRAHVRHIPVLYEGQVVACLSLRDLVQSELRQAEVEVRCLSEYVQGTEYTHEAVPPPTPTSSQKTPKD